jgi:hypothetical protein
MHGTEVGSEDHVWVEHRHKRVEVAAARGGEEGVDDFSLAGQICVGNRGCFLYLVTWRPGSSSSRSESRPGWCLTWVGRGRAAARLPSGYSAASADHASLAAGQGRPRVPSRR